MPLRLGLLNRRRAVFDDSAESVVGEVVRHRMLPRVRDNDTLSSQLQPNIRKLPTLRGYRYPRLMTPLRVCAAERATSALTMAPGLGYNRSAPDALNALVVVIAV
jgi:hypothetical protein